MKRITSFLVFTISIFAFLSCGHNDNKADGKKQQTTDHRTIISKEQFQKNNMSLGHITENMFPKTIIATGMIDVPPENRAVVNSIIGGYVKTIPLLVGDVVNKGQKLVTIENPEFIRLQQEYMEVKAELNYLKSEYDRQKAMYNENVISEKKYLMAESLYKSSNAKYIGLKKQLAMLNISPQKVEQGYITSTIAIYAPISGSITKVLVSKGSYISPTSSILEIINNDHIHIELSVFEKDILKIKKNQRIVFSIPEISEKTYNAKVYLTGTAIDENRAIKVHGHPMNKSDIFLTGMFVNAEIIVDEFTAIALPEHSIVDVDGSFYVLVLDEENDTDYYFKQVKIEVGSSANGFTQITDQSKLNSTDNVLVKGAFSLIETK